MLKKIFFTLGMIIALAMPLATRAVVHSYDFNSNSVMLAEEDESGEYDDYIPPRVDDSTNMVQEESLIVPQETEYNIIEQSETKPDFENPLENYIETEKIVISRNFPWAWLIARAAGLSSYLLLGLMTITGMMLTTGLAFRLVSPAFGWSFHRAVATTLLISVLLHVIALLFDNFINLSVGEVLIPWVSSFKPTLVALGIFGFYLLLLLLVTSLYTIPKYYRFWRIVHFSGFIMFTLIFLHGLLLGSDISLVWVKALYWGIFILVDLAVIYRLWWRYHQPAI